MQILVSGVIMCAEGVSIIFRVMLSKIPQVVGEERKILTVLTPEGNDGSALTVNDPLSAPAGSINVPGAV